jgi:hypothetical protein
MDLTATAGEGGADGGGESVDGARVGEPAKSLVGRYTISYIEMYDIVYMMYDFLYTTYDIVYPTISYALRYRIFDIRYRSADIRYRMHTISYTICTCVMTYDIVCLHYL